jgi:uncharacterized protein YecE (DUF72 family)
MRFFVGTSGYSFKEWKRNFYPEKLPQKAMLSYYAERFSTVEINNTFHKFPTEAVVQAWADQVPDSFRFVLKARQIITHFRRLQNAERETNDFIRIASVLKKRQGPILFQLPPNFKKDVPRLDAFLKHVAGRARLAFEFRHTSWFDEEVFECLRTHSTALCIAEADDLPSIDLVHTADWGYVRLRDEGYTDNGLKAWIKKITSQNWDEVFVFFKHEDAGAGPTLAARFIELAGAERKSTNKNG